MWVTPTGGIPFSKRTYWTELSTFPHLKQKSQKTFDFNTESMWFKKEERLNV